MSIVVIRPVCDSIQDRSRLNNVLDFALKDHEYETISTANSLKSLCGKKIIFAVELNHDGLNFEYIKMLSVIRRSIDIFKGCTAGIIVDGNSDLYTKSIASEITFAANLSGCAFLGRPLVEATGTLNNFRIQAKNAGCGLFDAYRLAAK